MFIIAFGFYNSLDNKVSNDINNLQIQLKQTIHQVDSLNTTIKKVLINKKDTILIQVHPQKLKFIQNDLNYLFSYSYNILLWNKIYN